MQQFGSSPAYRDRVRRWARTYAAPLVLSGAFAAMLLVAIVIAEPTAPTSAGTETAAPLVQPSFGGPLCHVCGIGERCDTETGRCMKVEASSPEECAKGAQYDEERQFCVPVATPRTTAPPSKTLDPHATPRSSPQGSVLVVRTPTAPFQSPAPSAATQSSPAPVSRPSPSP